MKGKVCLYCGQSSQTVFVHGHEQWYCGPIPNGNYWLNLNTRIWGYAGDTRPMGHNSDNCYNQERRRSLYERGLLFSPEDWLK